MSNPAYLWLTDENGSPMPGSCQVVGRVGAIEIKSLTATGTHLETVLLRYEKITWKHCDGNIIYTDEWNQRTTY